MAPTSNLEITAPSSSASSPPITWDVFLSFYGLDTRKNFTSHLYSALDQVAVRTFRDDPALEKGQGISSGLLNAIRDSKMFVVVISENYARSSWCLNELVEILSCKKTENQVVPVFYYVDPSDVRHQKGSFGDALDYHKKRYSVDTIDKWKSALAQIAELSGYHLKKHANESESETIQNIVENVEQQVSTKVLHIGEKLFGVDSAVEEIYQKLRMESNVVHAIGICGMGGIGKTTTAKAFYNKYYNRFDCCCFIENVKQYSQRVNPLLPLLEQLLTALLRRKDYKVRDVGSGIGQLKQLLRSKKALVVLDDLDQSSCSEFLARHCNLFSAGSRIIITTRDVNLLNQLKMDISEVDIYMVNELDQTHSLELFSYHAFGKPMPTANLRELSVSYVTYAGGLPLALKVLGSSLRGRTQDEVFWKVKLDKIRKIPENDILEILQLSYNELDDETVKSIFLDIAFFFIGKYEYEAFDIFESCDYFPEVGINILLERCLLVIDENKILHMHDLIQDMGRKLAKTTRLFLQGNAWEDLQNQEELDKIEGLILDLNQSAEKQINSQKFERLPKLRLLEIRDADGMKGHFKNAFHELRCIYWSYCSWTRLPSSFRPQKLISIHMPFSNFKILWDDVMPFTSLKTINLEYSVYLKMTPHFGNSKFVERLYFRGCESLQKIHPSITELTGLYVLDMTECIYEKNLAELVGRSSKLGYLYLGYCSKLRQLPNQLGGMKWLKELEVSYSTIEELPDSITLLKELVCLKVDGCKELKKLPEQIGNMEGLRTFNASCSAIEQLPDSFVGLINLETLDLRFCENLKNLPNSTWKLKLLKVLHLRGCLKLERLPQKLKKMQCLEELYASYTAIKEVPYSIGLLSRLRVLDLTHCKKLKYLPNSVLNLTSLTELHVHQAYIDRISLADTATQIFSSLKILDLYVGGGISSSTKPFSLSKLYNLQYLQLIDCTGFGSLFPELPPNITHLVLCKHETMVHLPDLSNLKQLKELGIYSFTSLQSVSPLPPHLESLLVYDCTNLQNLSEMSMLKELSDMKFGRCSNPKSVSLRNNFLQVKIVVKHFLHLLKAEVTKIADWFGYNSSGLTFYFDIPPPLGDDSLGLVFSFLFTCNNRYSCFLTKASVTNKTNGTSKYCVIPVFKTRDYGAFSVVQCVSGDEISIRSGDIIEVSFVRQLFLSGGEEEVPFEGVKVEVTAEVLQKTDFTPDFPSSLSEWIGGHLIGDE